MDRAVDKPERSRALSRLRRWAFAAVPLVGVVELGAHVVQTHSVVGVRDWAAARAYVAAQAKPEDLVVFAPRWADPVGRETFGSALATIEREARADEVSFPRALEVSIRGAHLPELDGWRKASAEHFGGVTVTTWDNPSPQPELDDLVSDLRPGRARVERLDGDREGECAFTRGPVLSGGLGFGPAVPADRYICPGGGFAGVSVVADLDYRPRRCIFAPPSGGNSVLRLRFADVRFGRTLKGHHALYVEAERNKRGAPVTVVFKVGESTVGTAVHRDGEGWKPFEFDTSSLEGKRAELVADISSPSGERRQYCFEAATR